MNQQYHSEEVFADILQKLTVFHSQEELAKWIDTLNLPFGKRNSREVAERLAAHLQSESKIRTEQILNEYRVHFGEQKISSEHLVTNAESAVNLGGLIGSFGIGSSALFCMLGLIAPEVAIVTSVASAIGGFFLGKSAWSTQTAKKVYPKCVELTEHLARQLTDIVVLGCKKANKQAKNNFDSVNTSNTYDISLTPEQLHIREFLDSRNIKYLVHFTDKRNIFSIKKFGLLPVSLLMQKQMEFVANDDARYDGHEDGISLSISEENIHVKQAFESRYPDREYQIIRIDASVLYLENTPRIYCQTNAATVSGRKGSAFEDLEAMFAQTVCYTLQNSLEVYSFTRHGQPANQPTVRQAEILWLGEIPLRYLHFD